MENKNIIYQVEDRPPFWKTVVFALQQLLAVLAATIAVPSIIGNGMSHSAALFGAGAGTLIYLLFTKFKSPVFLGSSFAFIGSMLAAFAGAVGANLGFVGIIAGAIFAGLVYCLLSLIVKFAGTKWINKLMPPVVIGPTVAIIGLSLAGNAIGDLLKGSYIPDGASVPSANLWICLLCGLVTLFSTIIFSIHGKKFFKMIPFIIGIAAGYVVAAIFTAIGQATGNEQLIIINFGLFQNMEWIPSFTFIEAFKQLGDIKGLIDGGQLTGADIAGYIGAIAVAYIPVAFVVFAEHIADHKNLSSIINRDLLVNPGLHRTLLGDGVGSMAGAFFGGCPNTTYGESIGTVAISGNASIRTILFTAVTAMILSFIAPFSTFLATIPSCVMGGVCIALYGFIAVSGLKMLKDIDLGEGRNLFVVSAILIAGIGGLSLTIGKVTLTSVACALILGIIVNGIVNINIKIKHKENEEK